jgi:hypothetical protein
VRSNASATGRMVSLEVANRPRTPGVSRAPARVVEDEWCCRLVGETTGPVRGPLLALEDAATSELASLLEHGTVPTPATS